MRNYGAGKGSNSQAAGGTEYHAAVVLFLLVLATLIAAMPRLTGVISRILAAISRRLLSAPIPGGLMTPSIGGVTARRITARGCRRVISARVSSGARRRIRVIVARRFPPEAASGVLCI